MHELSKEFISANISLKILNDPEKELGVVSEWVRPKAPPIIVPQASPGTTPFVMLPVVTYLWKIRDIVGNPDTYHNGYGLAVDVDGNAVDPEDESAVKWCIDGAIEKVVGYSMYSDNFWIRSNIDRYIYYAYKRVVDPQKWSERIFYKVRADSEAAVDLIEWAAYLYFYHR